MTILRPEKFSDKGSFMFNSRFLLDKFYSS